jgi:hypothetical protein
LQPEESLQRQRNVFLIFAGIMAPAIAILSFLPSSDKRILHTHGKYHSWGHLLAFSIVAFLLARMASSLRQRMLLFAGSLIFGLGIEVGEHLVFRSPLEWKDVLVDAMGVVGGMLIGVLSSPVEERTEKPG